MTERRPWQGMWTIARLNWPFYAAATLVLLAVAITAWFFAMPTIRWACVGIGAGVGYFVAGSLLVSHWVYDRSELYRWPWVGRALGRGPHRDFVFCHAGFDEASGSLRAHLGSAGWLVLDHFEPAWMTEPSIRRARRLFPPTAGTQPAPHDRWPLSDGSVDVVLGLLAIHELRSEAQRVAWFGEARRCLRAGGRVVLVEHLRDVANALAFGPGALHFHSAASWRRCWMRAGFRIADDFPLTAWVHVFVLVAA